MKKIVRASRYIDSDVYLNEGGGSGRTLSAEYAKAALLDYLSDYEFFKIDDKVSPEQFIERLQKLRPYFDIHDVTYVAQTYHKSLVEALEQLEDEYDQM